MATADRLVRVAFARVPPLGGAGVRRHPCQGVRADDGRAGPDRTDQRIRARFRHRVLPRVVPGLAGGWHGEFYQRLLRKEYMNTKKGKANGKTMQQEGGAFQRICARFRHRVLSRFVQELSAWWHGEFY